MTRVIQFNSCPKEITLTEYDIITMKLCLFRPAYLEYSKTTPKFKIEAIKYIRIRFDLGLYDAKMAVEKIQEEMDEIVR